MRGGNFAQRQVQKLDMLIREPKIMPPIANAALSSNSAAKGGPAQAQGPWTDLALHTLGWKAFQDLCAQICEEVLKQTVSIYRDAQDGGQDAVFLVRPKRGRKKAHTGTVQCKFVSDPKRRLRPSDYTKEKKSIRELVAKGEAHTYYFITNMGADAPVAAKIRKSLRGLGVSEPHVLGREWITKKIRESTRLRALVPRVYGLGDLSIILDERRAEQTQALLGHLLPALSVYVPTAAHRRAVTVFGKHGIVLLLGAPATGKSMLAAILATTALDGDQRRCFQVDGPADLISHWNPNEPGGFYWIDDAFGPNQLRTDYVDQWISIMNKVKAAINAGNRFVLTSRSHIWLAAKSKLATRNHPRFADASAVVDVGALSPEERRQILYNHIKAGNQASAWKRQVKPHLDGLSKHQKLLPEIARRLGDSSYTTGLKSIPQDLERFVAEPMEFLRETINELNAAQRAALTLVFLTHSKLSADLPDEELSARVRDKFAVSPLEIGEAFDQLNRTFLVKKSTSSGNVWAFAHPTVADALSAILGQRPDLVELYVRGTRIEALLSEVVCEGSEAIRDAVVVPSSVNDLLVSRILETPDEPGLNRTLFGFLCERASEFVLRDVLKQDPAVLEREAYVHWRLYDDPKMHLYAHVHKLGLLSGTLRDEAVNRLDKAIFDDLDGSFLDDDHLLSLIPPTRLLSLSVRLRDELFENLPEHVESITGRADLDIEAEENFDEVRSLLGTLGNVFDGDDHINEKIDRVEEFISTAIDEIIEQKQDTSSEWESEDIAPHKVSKSLGNRSMFSDVDE